MHRNMFLSLGLLAAIMVLAPGAFSQVELDVETGGVFSGYNDVRIPGDGGTRFSLSEELNADATVFYRIRVSYSLSAHHHLGALFAPLSIRSSGRLDHDLEFEGKTFPANSPLEATYEFNSYRLIYRYDVVRKEKVELGVGFTAKVRDARIAVNGNGIESEKSNVGFVPIMHFRFLWRFNPRCAFLVEGDALAAPQGRAEDVLMSFIVPISDVLEVKGGYRILEGGADNDEVYNFALINYASIGAILCF